MKARLLVAIIGVFIVTTAVAEKTDLKLIGNQGDTVFFTLSDPWISDAQMRAELATFQNDKMIWRCGKYSVTNSSNCFSD